MRRSFLEDRCRNRYMLTCEESRILTTSVRQRRPAFDRENGVEIARRLFHASGYDAVGIADLTQALGIVPPSLYAAYGSKLGLFERVLQSYCANNTLPLEKHLRPGRPPAEALTELMVAAARHYTRDPEQLGCMVTEAMQADDQQARALAASLAKTGSDVIRSYVAQYAARKDVERIADYVLLNLRGLSSYARLGYTQKKLVDCSRTAGRALDAEFA
ncbi:TetR/AcrR family transcriptional regulator [Sphingomonas sp. BIUV-7]|uniref:TetR/AcrR family transcriptional regulator n=1 Tax=Sphingomonas natans TaxID=3063330 RepID=A0ABT8YA62_9SPHN|nr:TetR/AcrR family transcriptional regulator [Sphingomonas sp. BIUV-7]MDO6415223.1 TetR/AcrR family transcriptional regulator [Sphingomonas sp. BIUV-7]